MKTIDELGISKTPWTCGTNRSIATILDGYEGKVIYANGKPSEVPYVGFANVVDGDIDSAIRNARLIAAAPDCYEALAAVVSWYERNKPLPYEENGIQMIMNYAKKAIARASGEEVK